MDKIKKINFLLEGVELDEIEALINKEKKFSYKKNMKVDILGQEFVIEFLIYRERTKGKIKFQLNLISVSRGEIEIGLYEEYSSGNYGFIGVKRIGTVYLTIKEGVELLININLKKSYLISKTKYRLRVLDLYGTYRHPLKQKELINELEFYNFEDEFNMLLCSYLLVKEGKAISNLNSDVLRLYKDKLYYIGIDIRDYYNSDIKDFSLKFVSKNKEETIYYFLTYIAFLIYSNEMGKRKIEEEENIAYKTISRYILLDK